VLDGCNSVSSLLASLIAQEGRGRDRGSERNKGPKKGTKDAPREPVPVATVCPVVVALSVRLVSSKQGAKEGEGEERDGRRNPIETKLRALR
jgi:hypothetical protein